MISCFQSGFSFSIVFYLPLARPALHCFFTGDSVNDEVEAFEPNKARDVVTGREAFVSFFFMFAQAFREITGHANIEGSVFSVGEDVNITISHGAKCRRWITRTSLVMTREREREL